MKSRFGQIIRISNISYPPKSLIGTKHIGHYLYCALISDSHKPGSLLKKANVLSRRIDHKRGVKNDNKNTMLMKPEYFHI
jgi:hypothetical protein